MVYPHYGWILYSWYPDNWWTEEIAGEHIDECTDEELADFLERARPLIINLVPEPDGLDIETAAGIVSMVYITTIIGIIYYISEHRYIDTLCRDGTDMRGDVHKPKCFQAPRMRRYKPRSHVP